MAATNSPPPAGPAIERRVLVVSVVAAIVWVAWGSIDASRAAFAASTSNGTNRVSTGSIAVTGDTPGTALFDLDRMTPGATAARCTRVVYAGSASADVRLHAAATGALTGALRVVVEVGDGPIDDGPVTSTDCSAFRPDASLFAGTLLDLAARHRSFATGLGGFADARRGESRSYRITATLAPDAVQSESARADLVWEAAP